MELLKLFLGFIACVVLAFKLPSILIFLLHLAQFIPWKLKDLFRFFHLKKKGVLPFRPYGLKMFCGRQGSGKTIGMVWYLERLRKKYPDALIYTNFGYEKETAPLESLLDLLRFRNGEKGVIFAIDELQNEFSSSVSKNFPETLLSEITQQRKQKITILSTSQVFSRVAKPLREQCYEVIECRTFGGRWTRLKCYDASDYCTILDSTSPDKKFKLPKKWSQSFIQSDRLREMYDTYAKIVRLSRHGFKDTGS